MKRRFKEGSRVCIPARVIKVNDSQNHPDYQVESERGRLFLVYEDEVEPRENELVRTTSIRDLSGKKIRCTGRLSEDCIRVYSESLPADMDEDTRRIISNYSVIFGAGLTDGRLMATCRKEDFEDCCERLAQAYFAALVILSRRD